MIEREFKVLMYAGAYVNLGFISKGIYASPTPVLYSKDTTMDSLIERINVSRDALGSKFVSESEIENIKKCTLVSVTLIGEF